MPIVKLLKMCKADVYTIQTIGSYLAAPKWALEKRKYPITVKCVKTLSKDQIKELDNQEAAYMQTTHVTNSNELRGIYAEKVHELLREYRHIYIDGKSNNINDILNDIDAFNTIWENGYVTCNHLQRYWDTCKVTIDTKRIEKEINKEHSYFDRLRALKNGTQFLIEQRRKLELSKTKIRSRAPSLTFTCTFTVSPTSTRGISFS